MVPRRNYLRMTPRPLVRGAALGLALLGSVTCDPPFPSPHMGRLIISATTSGVDTDSDGYGVILDGQPLGMITPNGAITLDTILSGRHRVTLDSVATNCAVAAPPVRDVQVPREDSVVVAFGVFCRIRIGSVRVAVTTTGPDPDANGYTIAFDSGPAQGLPRNGTAFIGGLHEGTHSMTVGDVAPNCLAGAPVPNPVLVEYGTTSDVSLHVACGLTSGTIEVTVSTTGTNLDPDGYVVSVDGVGRLAIGLNGVWWLSGVRADTVHFVGLGGVASNCTVTPPGHSLVPFSPGDTVHVAFAVDCWSPGAVAVTATTTGVDPDTNGYSITLERPGYATTTNVSANGTAVVPGLAPSAYALTVTGLANNCAMAVPPPDTVTVLSGDTAAAAFTVACTPSTGTIRIVTATTGSAPDSNGYLVRVDYYCDYYGSGCSSLFEDTVGVNDTVTVAGVPIGGHGVSLWDVASNCEPATTFTVVTLAGGDTATVTFPVRCDPPGAIEAIITTAGPLLDQNGYDLQVSGPGGTTAYPVAANDTIVAPGLVAGTYSLTLFSVDQNCAVTPPNPRTVPAPSGDTAHVTFQVTCFQPGALAVSVTTTGPDPDPDGYFVQVFGPPFATASVPANGGVLFENLPAGGYTVTLSNTSANCATTPPNPRAVPVLSGDTAATAFTVTCVAAARLAYASNQAGNEDVYSVLSNGADVRRLTTHAAADAEPAWSPDGTKLAFVSRRDSNPEIYVMNADGSGQTRLTNSAADDLAPAWSPDGTKLAFVSRRDGNLEIYVMNADGSNPVRLTNNTAGDEDPVWSPDGSKIAFATDRDGNFEIYAMNADGGSPVRLTTNAIPDLEPDWSPDGARIAFTRFAGCGYYYCDYDVWVMNADGSGAALLTTAGIDVEPAWSPDGALIALTRRFCDDYYGCSAPYLYLHRADGAEWFVVYNAYQPAWKR